MSPLLITTIVGAVISSPTDLTLINNAVCDYIINNLIKFLVELSLLIILPTLLRIKIAQLIQLYTIIPVRGDSMSPTLNNDDLVLVKCLDDGEEEVGDVIIFEHDGVLYVKRIVATSHSLFEIDGGITILDNVIQVEEFIEYDATYSFHPPRVPYEHVVVLGDNRNDSDDSHLWSDPFLPCNQIIGKVVHVSKSRAMRAVLLTYFFRVDKALDRGYDVL